MGMGRKGSVDNVHTLRLVQAHTAVGLAGIRHVSATSQCYQGRDPVRVPPRAQPTPSSEGMFAWRRGSPMQLWGSGFRVVAGGLSACCVLGLCVPLLVRSACLFWPTTLHGWACESRHDLVNHSGTTFSTGSSCEEGQGHLCPASCGAWSLPTYVFFLLSQKDLALFAQHPSTAWSEQHDSACVSAALGDCGVAPLRAPAGWWRNAGSGGLMRAEIDCRVVGLPRRLFVPGERS